MLRPSERIALLNGIERLARALGLDNGSLGVFCAQRLGHPFLYGASGRQLRQIRSELERIACTRHAQAALGVNRPRRQ